MYRMGIFFHDRKRKNLKLSCWQRNVELLIEAMNLQQILAFTVIECVHSRNDWMAVIECLKFISVHQTFILTSQVTVNVNELNLCFLYLQVLWEVHCVKSKVKWLVRKPNTQSRNSKEACVSEKIYLGNQYYTLKPLMHLTTAICKHIIMWWHPGTADQSSAGWYPWWCIFVPPHKSYGLRSTDAFRIEKKSSQCLTALFRSRLGALAFRNCKRSTLICAHTSYVFSLCSPSFFLGCI